MMEVAELIPQRPPIVLVDRFLGLEEGVSRTCFAVAADCLFVDGGRMTECGLIEHMAQSAAARVGFLCKEQGRAVPIGYIGAVNDLRVERLPQVGELLSTEIRVVQEVFGISLIEAVCRAGDRAVASCRMKIFLES